MPCQNGISIDGEIENWFTDDSVKRFDSYGWQTIEVDGHNVEHIKMNSTKGMFQTIPQQKEEQLIGPIRVIRYQTMRVFLT